MMDERPYFFDLTAAEVAETFAGWGLPRFRAKQVIEWVYAHGVADPRAMTNLGKADRELLAERMTFLRGTVVRHQSATDGTQKLLMEWDVPPAGTADGEGRTAHVSALPVLGAAAGDPDRQTECVMIPSEGRRTACISSQIGCPVGCRFCASGLGGLGGNLSSGQIVEQVWQLQWGLGSLGARGLGLDQTQRAPVPQASSLKPQAFSHPSSRISNVVFMGMGEPLSNFDHVTRAAKALIRPVDEGGMGISGRKVTISTVGLPAQIRRLAELDLPITLAISLHAPNDEVRKKIIPWAEFVKIEQLVEAGAYYFDRTGREVTLEYILLAGVNDQAEHARELSRVAKRLRSNVNLIRYNEVMGLPFGRPRDEDVRQFQEILRRAGVNVHIRASRGRDIAAACGQLRHESRKPAGAGV